MSIQQRFSRISKLWSPSPTPAKEETTKRPQKAITENNNRLEETPWIVEDRPIDGARPIRVVIIGSGLSGILASIRFRQRIQNVSLTVYEKNDDIGGTWYENRYPGCACGRSMVEFILIFDLLVNMSRHSCTHLSSHI